MEYRINLGCWNSVFAVPCEIVDKYLNTLDGIQIKVLFYALRHGGELFNTQELSDSIGISLEETSGALETLCNMGLLFSQDSQSISSKIGDEKNTNSEVISHKKVVVSEVKYQRPNAGYIAERIKGSQDIYYMMQEAQEILSRPLSTSDSAILLTLHDNDGLPIDVIVMLLQYAASVGKTNMKYISKAGQSWAEEGIDNLEKAEKKIESLNHKNMIWKRFESLIGIEHRAPTATESEAVIRWFDTWKFDDTMVREAYERCVNMNGRYVLKYMDSIIKRWHNQGIVSIEQAIAENSKKHSRTRKSETQNSNVSYNIEEYENYNILNYIN